jgi:hypothetical protein
MATATKPQIPYEAVKWLTKMTDSAAVIAQNHAALLAQSKAFHGPTTVEATRAAIDCVDTPPAVPIGRSVAFRATEIAFPKVLSAAVSRLVAALEPYRSLSRFIGGTVPSLAAFKQGDSQRWQRELVAAVVGVQRYLPADEVALARNEIAAVVREERQAARKRWDERTARARKEFRENGGTIAFYRNSKARYTVRATGETNMQSNEPEKTLTLPSEREPRTSKANGPAKTNVRSRKGIGGKRQWDHAVDEFETWRDDTSNTEKTDKQFIAFYRGRFTKRDCPSWHQLRNAINYRKRSGVCKVTAERVEN